MCRLPDVLGPESLQLRQAAYCLAAAALINTQKSPQPDHQQCHQERLAANFRHDVYNGKTGMRPGH